MAASYPDLNRGLAVVKFIFFKKLGNLMNHLKTDFKFLLEIVVLSFVKTNIFF